MRAMNTYRPKDFAKLIAKTTGTLQRWDRDGILKAHRSPTNRRFYTHDHLAKVLGVQETALQLVIVEFQA